MEFITKQGIIYLLDEQDSHLAGYAWTKNSSGYLRRTIYDKTNKGGYRTLFLHRFIAGATNPNQIVDHINRDKYDNRRSNSRIGTQSDNLFNSSKGKQTTSSYWGVSYTKDYSHRNMPWAMNLKDGTRRYRGLYFTELEALKAYEQTAHKFNIRHNCNTEKGSKVDPAY